MSTDADACKVVAKGGVGESGASLFLSHTVGGPISKFIVLRNVNTSLCPNTGAVGLLVVNGLPVASGELSAAGSAIHTEATAGAHVAAIVHTVPLFNGVVCIRLGELSVTLEECDRVPWSEKADRPPGVLQAVPATRDWYAWNDMMPPKPDTFHVVGEVQVPNPGVDVLLVPRTPQGINPKILLLNLILVQRSGLWPHLVVWKRAHYEKVNADYESVQIFSGDEVIANVPVEIVR
jgi:hypothetical protein